jgi:WD40 repeat protein
MYVCMLAGHVGRVTSVAWCHDDLKLVSGGFDYSVRVWDAYTGAELANLQVPRSLTKYTHHCRACSYTGGMCRPT